MKRVSALLILLSTFLWTGTAFAANTFCSCAPQGGADRCVSIDTQILTGGQRVNGPCARLPSVVGISLNGWTCKPNALPGSAPLCEKPVDAFAAGAAPAGETPSPSAGTNPNTVGPPITPILNVQIPGLQFTPQQGGSSPLLAQYIGAAYNYLIAVSVTAATVMFTWGAFRYLLGSTPAFDAKRGKEIMTEAVIGLILVFGANMILRTVNPATVQLRSLAVDSIQAIAWENEDVLDANATLNPNASGKPVFARGRFLPYSADELAGSEVIPVSGKAEPQPLNVPMFKMFIGPWAKDAYGPANVSACPGKESRSYAEVQCCTTYARAGCGPSSLATLLLFDGVNADPETVGTLLSSLNARICNQGTLFSGGSLSRISQASGLTDSHLVSLGRGINGVKAAITVLREGKPVMFLCSGCSGQTSSGKTKSYAGHYMVLTGVDTSGRIFTVSDVGNSGPTTEMVNILQSDLAKRSGGFWAIRKR